MNRLAAEAFLGSLDRIEVLVVGDLMLDEYLWGRTERISPEAPVQVVDVVREELRLGGAGNVINNLVALGARVRVASVLGDDDDGRLLRRLLAERGVDCSGIILAPGRTTSRKTRVLASSQQIVRIDRETRAAILPEQERELAAFLAGAAATCRVILVSDYLKGVLPESLLGELIAHGRRRNIPVVIDPKGNDYRKYRGATVLTPNRKEAQAASGVPIVDEASLRQAGQTLCRDLDLESLVLTRSEEGMSLFYRDGRELHLPTQAREVFDVSGAGDTVLALIGLGLAAGLPLADAAQLSNVAAGVVVGKVGTSTVAADEILDAIGRQHRDPDGKLHERLTLARLLDARRAQGKTIVFTNGCFDLLHVGHVKYLQAARKLGDLLVLGLNSDASIRRLKGEKRPLIGEDERAHILAALDCIDFVVIFDEDTPLELIGTLRPDILVKGADYTPEGVVGKDLVESWGGRVELIDFVDGKSTTNIIDKILQSYQP
ncbi:MAG: bifunctional D-glycero-beta-D-manno-heptose-7-phosphate kinase/D-glycero-beta-D-manno-heptose 1-phosphate adenylyltransferase HldE [Deltaproteobacteria bacterium]|nr:MAG: bifunctional D-glycero-beta-D-manno-heptose-7-phosphate kinase/D-glycero-beta-D-manno-heptose 1-phosphate adenylyltransferase HldE [Deltaproteobacteria bacterium]